MIDPRIEAAAEAIWNHRPMARNADGLPTPWIQAHEPYATRYREFAKVAIKTSDSFELEGAENWGSD
jgi:hypothetical protein